jgi:hypothetical protein
MMQINVDRFCFELDGGRTIALFQFLYPGSVCTGNKVLDWKCHWAINKILG